MKVLSLGAGVQSSTLLLMCLNGEFGDDYPRHAIFADTGWEPKEVYEWLNTLIEMTAEIDPEYQIHIVGESNIRTDATVAQKIGHKTKGVRWGSMPYFTVDRETKQHGIVRRQCTSEYKLAPLQRKQRELLGYKPRQRIPADSMEVWIGISLDEVIRMKPALYKWQKNRFPLIDKHMTRADCKIWMKDHGYPEPPRSACIACPFKSDWEWRRLKLNSPEEFQDAVEFDETMRECGGMRGDLFVHRSCKPLSEADLETLEDKGQLNFFNNECEGMCGV